MQDLVIVNFVLEHLHGKNKDLIDLISGWTTRNSHIYISSWLPVYSFNLKKLYNHLDLNWIEKQFLKLNLEIHDILYFFKKVKVEEEEFENWILSTNQKVPIKIELEQYFSVVSLKLKWCENEKN